LACGYYRGVEDLVENWEIDRTWQPRMEEIERSRLYGQWKKAVTRSFDWID
jgi:glycerol kinase